MTESVYISLDVEATGPNPNEHFVPVFGVSVLELSTRSGSPVTRIIAEYQQFLPAPPGRYWCESTIKNFWEKKVDPQWYESVRRYVFFLTKTSTLENCMMHFLMWCFHIKSLLQFYDQKRIYLITDTTWFDSGWFSHILPKGYELSTLFSDQTYLQIVDTSSFYKGAIISESKGALTTALHGNFERLCELLKINIPVWEGVTHDHRPVNDARVTALNYIHILSYYYTLKKVTNV